MAPPSESDEDSIPPVVDTDEEESFGDHSEDDEGSFQEEDSILKVGDNKFLFAMSHPLALTFAFHS